MWLDEPWFGELMRPGFPIAPDPAIDLLSAAMAVLEPVATVGVHCCADADIASLLAAGPSVLSVPVDARLADVAGYLAAVPRATAGAIAWGVVPTDGPIAHDQRALLAPAQRPVVRARPPRLRSRSSCASAAW